MLDYAINPILMGGLVKAVEDGQVKVHLHGRLGVITVPRRLIVGDVALEPGHELQFYFSYLQVNETPYDYDCAGIDPQAELSPCLIGGKLIEVNDTAVKLQIMQNLGTVAVPRRWVFTSAPLQEGQNAEFYFSCMKVIGKREIPARSI